MHPVQEECEKLVGVLLLVTLELQFILPNRDLVTRINHVTNNRGRSRKSMKRKPECLVRRSESGEEANNEPPELDFRSGKVGRNYKTTDKTRSKSQGRIP